MATKPPTNPEPQKGLKAFSINALDKRGASACAKLKKERPRAAAFAIVESSVPANVDAHTAAYNYLIQALESDSMPGFARPDTTPGASTFKTIGTSTQPLTRSTIVQFRQYVDKVPVYSSYVAVELDANNELLSIQSSLGGPTGGGPLAKLSPAAALAIAAKAAGRGLKAPLSPARLYHHYSPRKDWRLAYIIEDMPVKKGKTGASVRDYVIDANRGTVIAELNRHPSVVTSAEDDLGNTVAINVMAEGGVRRMRDDTLNIETYDFSFRNPDPFTGDQAHLLPGDIVTDADGVFEPGAVSAHANAAVVANFLRNAVKRNNIDGRGGLLISSVHAVDVDPNNPNPADPQVWLNAFWNNRQMVYGQIRDENGVLRTLATHLDVVGHEMFHGVTGFTARLEYQGESGALNESYSDIFGVIIANSGEADLTKWDWRIGNGLRPDGSALRDMSQKKTIADFDHGGRDHGMVHKNSQIHNFAFFSVATQAAAGNLVFTKEDLIAIFYSTLTGRLTQQSGFSDSRNGAINAVNTLFRDSPDREAKAAAVAAGFRAAGI